MGYVQLCSQELRSREARLREEMQSQETRPGKEASPEGEVKVSVIGRVA